MRQCLENSGSPALTPAPPLSSSSSDCTTASTDTDRQSFPSVRRGTKRRSAGLSILSTSSPNNTGGVKTLKAFACADQKNRIVNHSVSHLEQKETSTASSTPTLVNGTPVTENFGNATRDSTSRESLDSAIGMSVTGCDLCSQEPCRCREVIMSSSSSSAFEVDRLRYWRNKELWEQQEQQLQQNLKQQPTRTLRRTGQTIGQGKILQYRGKEPEQEFCALGISNSGNNKVLDTGEELKEPKGNDNGGRLTPVDKVKDSSGEGDQTGHSPQSFKQRVMRKRDFSYVRGS
ncbi:hypothetical protein B0T21DRAFT_357885 [Apiosordaria backusii]|uniref:Uncharacterized protein n=1 Tax=Apiosordaria backusii TaxID=314023 RepID=A0AA40ES28_9PEZI|nr:hypothetical protein B0T21DRAFT_357885 [Apiosordaria backusii]